MTLKRLTKRLTSKRVVVTWGFPIAGSGPHEAEGGYRKTAAELYRDLIERFEHIDLLQFSAGKCVLRTVVLEDEDAADTAADICAALKERGIDAAVRVVDTERETLPDRLRQSAAMSGATMFTDAANEIEKNRSLIKRLRQQLIDIKRLRQQLIDATSAKAKRYKHAAEALWQALNSIAKIDSISGDDDADFRLHARSLANLRLEHARSDDGQTLVWAWQRLVGSLKPLPPGWSPTSAHDDLPLTKSAEKINELGIDSLAVDYGQLQAQKLLGYVPRCFAKHQPIKICDVIDPANAADWGKGKGDD